MKPPIFILLIQVFFFFIPLTETVSQNIYLGINSSRLEPLRIYQFDQNYLYSAKTNDLIYVGNSKGEPSHYDKSLQFFGISLPATRLMLEYDRWLWNVRMHVKRNDLVREYVKIGDLVTENVKYRLYLREVFLTVPLHVSYKLINKYKSPDSPYIFSGLSYNWLFPAFHEQRESSSRLNGIFFNDKKHHWTFDAGIGYTFGAVAIELAGKTRLNIGAYKIQTNIYFFEFTLHIMKWIRSSTGHKNSFFPVYKNLNR